MFRQMAMDECECKSSEVNFSDESVMDIGPYLVWGLMREEMLPFMRGGGLTMEVKSVIAAVGMDRFMQMEFGRQDLSTDILPFKLQRRMGPRASAAPESALHADARGKVADDLVATVNRWLGKMQPARQLSAAGVRMLLNVIGEVLDNAERHSEPSLGQKRGNWAIAGFMIRREKQGQPPLFACHLGIVSIGASIAESLATAPDPGIGDQVRQYQDMHRNCGRSGDTLATVIAMQDGVSRVTQGPDQPAGGVGFMDMVDYTAQIGSLTDHAPHRIAVISGRSCLLFHGPYGRPVQAGPDGRRRLLFFNENNSILEPPALAHVFDLPERFPGTIIALRFALPVSKEEAA